MCKAIPRSKKWCSYLKRVGYDNNNSSAYTAHQHANWHRLCIRKIEEEGDLEYFSQSDHRRGPTRYHVLR